MKVRQYTMTARADAARETGERIQAAAFALLSTRYYDDVTLDAIAADADVTVQTVIRRFGSKDGLVRALIAPVTSQVSAQRGQAPTGDLVGTVANLVEHYEGMGDLAMLLLRQEERVPPYAEATAVGKQVHSDWVRSVFSPWLDARTGAGRERLHAQLLAMCDVYTWYLLRRQQGLSRRQTELALAELLKGVLS
ncbi:TetR/AcrR family transcriptional regulator [Agromyces albus]|uniref:TetR/AcrR family transcriptional regulator n=1 Tax=Agromyces albus TaxID=205332 RepID=UPI0027806228|nr:TetR/AcrR family transcriptional regulator [Agromyces albus]MDQ0574193.1 AcrR family transcriptional regulator [Agromyces albus]